MVDFLVSHEPVAESIFASIIDCKVFLHKLFLRLQQRILFFPMASFDHIEVNFIRSFPNIEGLNSLGFVWNRRAIL